MSTMSPERVSWQPPGMPARASGVSVGWWWHQSVEDGVEDVSGGGGEPPFDVAHAAYGLG